ncbi:glycosyltransferase family 2 protein [Actinoplanes palleronii]|uniref:Glycosyl transferase n=1 Tax=Actinoplanes palleronii TaxID=113570 RepID=A0ABQ4B0M3_9ACTN|nr:glycosyltransferase family 2 protein [Actinoplanes palleronii]GIE64107.1 glycosyl transferase [Actinoplanes palleronii]
MPYDYDSFSRLAGPLDPVPHGDYRVRLQPLTRHRPVRSLLITIVAFTLEATFFGWLITATDFSGGIGPATALMVAAIALVELIRLINVITLCLATMRARDPVPVPPDTGLRVAFLTTIVPGKEPIDMVERTLRAAGRIDGGLDVWLLDEGDDAQVRTMCAAAGARHFSRKGVARWNQEKGAFKARTKHGNYNAWVDAHGDDYDVFVSVDPDHVPLPSFGERLLGYFRDPDVAFVVGPQIYGNYDNLVTRWAESQQYLFHSLLQRAGNTMGAPMLVGTNNAVRIAALRSIGGLQDSITEDMATSLALHATRNPVTGQRWRSVYTPDVLAVGEGPSSWTDYFSQQHRWSRGTDEVCVAGFRRRIPKLGVRRTLHYALLMAYYPMTAVSWLLGTATAVAHIVLGVRGVQVPQQVWFMLYVDAALFQVGLYLWNRRHNVSPHEEAGSSGLTGMLLSTLCAPIYVASLRQTLLRRTAGFVVTPKGDSTSPDRLGTFRTHLSWAAFFAGLLVFAVLTGRTHGLMWMWPALNLLLCLAPPVLWATAARPARKAATIPAQRAGEPVRTYA